MIHSQKKKIADSDFLLVVVPDIRETRGFSPSDQGTENQPTDFYERYHLQYIIETLRN